MTGKTLLTAVVLMAMAMSAVSCVQPSGGDEDGAAAAASPSATPAEQTTPEPAESADGTLDGLTLQATVETELGAQNLIGYYSDDSSNDQCVDLAGATPVQIDCAELTDVEDCAVVLLGEARTLAVLCAVTAALWGVDLGYEGAYTTAAGERGEVGVSCRTSIPDGQGECSAAIAGETVTYEPTVIEVGAYAGLALLGPPEPSDAQAAAFGELAVTTGLETVIVSTYVQYADDEPFDPDTPAVAYLGLNAFASLDQNAAIAEGFVFDGPLAYTTLSF